jgi:hypothetical protein
MFLGGLWHGASWNFILWGTLHGVALAAHKWWMSITGRRKGDERHGLRRILGVVVTFHFVCLCWIFFRNATFDGAVAMLRQIATDFHPELLLPLIGGYVWVFVLMALGFLLHFAPQGWESALRSRLVALPMAGKVCCVVALIYFVIQIKSSEIQPFIYFQF